MDTILKNEKVIRIGKSVYMTLMVICSLIVAREILSVWPSVTVVTGVLAFMSAKGRWKEALISGATVYGVTALNLGFGSWILFQVIAVGVVVLISYFCRSEWSLLGFASLSGFLWGFITNFSMFVFVPFSWDKIWLLQVSSFTLDIIHSLSTIATVAVLLSIRQLIRRGSSHG